MNVCTGVLSARPPAVLALASLAILLSPALSKAGETGPQDPPAAHVTGRLQGSVVVGPGLSSRRMRFDLYPDLGQASSQPRAYSRAEDLKNVIIFLLSVPTPHEPARRPAGPPMIQQVNLAFEPHVLPVVKGTTVEFPNGDPIFHNVFSLSKTASFDLGRYPRGSSRSVRFDKPGIVKVFCHIHSDMSAVVMVLENPFFTVPNEEGHYLIDGIPPGEYTVAAWHERARLVTREVRIDPGQPSFTNFTIPLSEAVGSGSR
jgi:hypothetical protein